MFKFFIAALFSICALQADKGEHYTFAIESDTSHEVQFDIPDDWRDIEENVRSFYDLKLKSNTGDRQCIFWFGKIDDEPINTALLFDISSQIKDELFSQIETRNHSISTKGTLSWQSFQTGPAHQPHFVGIAVFSIKDYVFAVVLENDKDIKTLMDDTDLFLQNISLLTNKQ
jgi:hypothetical protein